MADMRTLTVDGTTYNIKDATARADIATLQTNVTTLQTNVTTLQTNVTTLQTNVTTLQTNVTTLQENTADLPQIRENVENNSDDISDLKSAIAKNQIYDTASGAIASFPDGADNLPIQELAVNVDPVQDLHGYDHPWPAGGGKNLINYLSCIGVGSRNGTDGVYSNNTVSLSGNILTVNLPYRNNGGILKGIQYPSIESGTPFTVSFEAKCTGTDITVGYGKYEGGGTNTIETVRAAANTWTTITKTYTSQGDSIGLFIQPTALDTVLEIRNLQLELSSTATSYAPYSNICPISGRTGVNVTRCGKNLLDFESAHYYNNNIFFGGFQQGNNIVVDGTFVLKAGTYTVSANANMTAWYLFDETGQIGIAYNIAVYTFTLSEEKAICLRCYKSDTTAKEDFVQYDIQLELGSTATEYEPYQGSTYSITFPTEAGTVYGGTLTVHNDGTGELVVDRANIASYAGETLPGAWISDRDVYSAGTTPTTGAQVVYDLATPTTYTLTASQVCTLLGYNNIWADTGDVEVNYPADTKLYIDSKIAEAIAAALNV